ncbi:MAG: LysR family transcriptional regulator [Curvibacter sp.]|jgi:DNA-binding transcriptional LysR family regulator|nr:LysR family transcriptional regulator [Curvibacter sp.]
MPRKTESNTPARLTDWNLLRSFLAVYEAGTLTAAADELGLSQPTLGRHVRELELLLGETLFDRLPGRMKPTDRAIALAARLGPLQEGIGSFDSAVASKDDLVSGTVRVTTSELMGALVLPALIGPLLLAEPLLQIEIQATDEVENLLRREADVAVRLTRPKQDDVIAVSVGKSEIGLFAHESFIRSIKLETLADLKGRYIGGVDLQRALEASAAAGHPLTYDDFHLRSTSHVAQLTAIEAGVGVGAVFVPVAQGRQGLRRLLPEAVALPVEVWLCAHEDMRRSARIRRVFDYLLDAVRAYLSGASG